MRREDYRIDIINLKNGVHEYDFIIDESFFSFFDNSIVDEGNLKTSITLEKNDRLIRCLFNIKGHVRLVCDRSLKEYDEKIDRTFEHVFKFSESGMDDTEDITHIGLNTESIDLGQLIYEFISISIPMKKIHPDHRNDESENGFFYKTEGEEKEKKEEESVDPRWEALKKLK
jgi:uncharacterized metal-binding protein YceD (DUF177 family)